MGKRHQYRKARQPNFGRVKKWLEETGINKEIERYARKVAKRPKLNISEMKNPIEEVMRIITTHGVRWPIERELSAKGRAGQYFYEASLVREDRYKIRTLIRSALDELPRKEWRPFLSALLEHAKKQREAETENYKKSENKRDMLLHARKSNIALGIEMVCIRMLKLI
ncbi:MAG: hypothetical protein N3F05_03620 [Candidatus Diapherotrites archaeon]|nr:hypothetical protein [Candidatus Diapherotrites archaeon]